MSTPARERSAFGQFQLNRSGIDVGVNYSKVKQQASAGDMAELLRQGVPLAYVAGAFDLSESTVRQRLITAGWSSTTGQPTSVFPDPEVKAPRPTLAFVDQPWAADALCAQTDPEAFFPEKGGSPQVAKSTCAKCFVQAECLDYALTNNERFGIWGGLSERERRRLSGTTAHQQRATNPRLPERTAS